MARNGEKPSDMLQMLISKLGLPIVEGMVDRNVLVQHFADAFCFFDGEAYPIFGWFPSGAGELKDPNIDYLLTRRIQGTREQWDRQG
jgi:hypothetical protein